MEEKKNRGWYFPVVFALVLIFGIYLGGKLVFYERISGDTVIRPSEYNKVNDIINYIEEYYVDTVSKEDLQEIALNELLMSLDPHSYYIPASALQTVNEPLEGSFEGVGIEFNIQTDTIMVVATISGGPAEKEGVMPGDRIVMIDDEKTTGASITNNIVFKKLRGRKGTMVKISIVRPGYDGLLHFNVFREKIPSKSVDVYFMVDDQIAYMKVSKFSATTYDEFFQAAQELRLKGMKKLIFDLRGNGGGYLDAAVNICDEFLSDGKLIVYTEGRARPREDIDATSYGILEDVQLTVLIDEWSASASEIVAGAIQDNDRGTIIGRRSFGKGLVQEQVALPDGSALRLTIARYHTPTGRCIQKSYANGVEEYMHDLFNRYAKGEFSSSDSIHLKDTLKYLTPEGKTVYGGGGIMPDIFVPLDTTGASKYLRNIIAKGHIVKYAFRFADANRKKLEDAGSPEAAMKLINTTRMMNQFVEFADSLGTKKDPIGLAISGKLLEIQIRAYIMRNIYGDTGFYPEFLQIDETYNRAVREMKGRKQ
ncbi:MAG: S41 family peptidase [Bacteroidetes bacterium]|nr:S41 family peptidase [Bacteroidota bacterium]MBU1720809.1 S41 family peptidase [Bacteroidota bacterium]